MQNIHRSRLMSMSWEIQKGKDYNRSKSLFAAWAIFLNEDIVVYHLVRKHSNRSHALTMPANHLTLFPNR